MSWHRAWSLVLMWLGSISLIVSAPALAQEERESATPVVQSIVHDAELSCRVCHPGATKGLARSPHAILNTREDLRGKVCASCHGDLHAHGEAVGKNLPNRPIVAAVSQASCNTCHPGSEHKPSYGAHLLAVIGSGAPPPQAPGRDLVRALEETEAADAIQWSGFAELGYRFVHHSGSRDAFRTDLDLEPTIVLRDFELRGRGSEAAAIDDFTLRGRDIGDPRWDVGASLTKADRFEVDSRYRRGNYLFATSGDYHRVDRNSRDLTTSVSGGTKTWQVFATHTNREEDGFWLTQRIGNQNLPVQTFVNGVRSPRQLRADDGEVGIRGEVGPLHVTVAAGFVDERSNDRWSYSQPATGNPGFPESENLGTTSHLDGPTARITIAHDSGSSGPLHLELSGQVRDLRRDQATTGTGAGFDTAAFTTTTAGTGRGDSRLMLWQLDSSFDCTDSLRLLFTARHRDYEERVRLELVDVRTVPSPSSVVTTTTARDDETVQRLFDGDLSLEWSPTDDFDIAVGYGIAREQLRIAAPAPADPLDYRRGHLDDDGFLAHVRWRFAEEWTFRADGRDFATDGLPLHEVTPQSARQAKATLQWQRDPGRVSVFGSHRHNDNKVTSHRLDAFTTGLSGSFTTDAVSLTAGYTFADIESRTRTNFYFDPDPAPQATLVGFTGETHTWTLLLVMTPHELLEAEVGSAVTRTIGSFAVDTVDVHAGMRWRCTENGSAGVEWRQVRYDDQYGTDDWAADLVFVYWRQEW